MRELGCTAFVLLVISLGFDRVASWPYGTTLRMVAHYVGAALQGV